MIVFELQIDLEDSDPKIVLVAEVITRAMSGLAMSGVDSALGINKYDETECIAHGEDDEGGSNDGANQ